MQHFNWLYVDDREEFRERARSVEGTCPQTRLSVASDEAEAVERLRSGFFQLAFVDLELKLNEGPGGGLSLLGLIKRDHPVCERIVHSRVLYDHPDVADTIDKLFHPRTRIADGLFDKIDPDNLLELIVSERSKAWLRTQVDVEGLDGFDGEAYRRFGGDEQWSELACREEINYLISRLCGQGDVEVHDGPQAVDSIDLEVMSGGATRAMVLRGQPKVGDHLGVWLVFKIDFRDDIVKEYSRYRQHICFRVSKNRRVELIGIELANRLGAICYTFAGSSPEIVSLLSDVISHDEESAKMAVETLFHPDEKDLHNISAPPQSLFQYFKLRFGERFRPRHAIEGLSRLFTKAEKEWSDLQVRRKGDELLFKGGKLKLSGELLTDPVFHEAVPCCVVHGDLHLGNIVVGAPGEVIMIDFKDSGPAPRCLDFAVFDTSLRLQEALNCKEPLELLKAESRDKSVLRACWSKAPKTLSDGPFGITEQLAYRTVRYLRQTFPDVTAREYAAACIAWSCHLLNLDSIKFVQKIRLIGWISALKPMLQPKAKRQKKKQSGGKSSGARNTDFRDFFVSYNKQDERWAEWIAWTLEEAGYSTIIGAWDFGAGSDFVLQMQKAATNTRRTIAVLSDNYLEAEYTHSEWSAAFARDPRGEARTLVPVRVGPCHPGGLLSTRIFADLVGLSEEDAKRTLLDSLETGNRPNAAPTFPGSKKSSQKPEDRESPIDAKRYPGNPSSAMAVWVEKLEFLQEHEATTVDVDQKFALKKQIEAAEQRIEQLRTNEASEDE